MSEEKPLTNSALLYELRADIKVIKAELTVISDHESRIRALEKARYQSAILISIATAVLSSAAVASILKAIA
jgi:hypothetical protein